MPRLSASQLPRLQLSKEEEHDLRHLSCDLEREILLQYEDFVAQRQRVVDVTQWKAVRSQGDLDAYRERDDESYSIGMPRPRRIAPKKGGSVWIGPQAALAKKCDASMVMMTGLVCCTLDEAAYALSFHDTASFRALNAYHDDKSASSGVLSMLEDANNTVSTDLCPFRIQGITWQLQSDSLGGLVSSRDSLMLSHLSYTQLATGERIGVWLQHSVQHVDVPEMMASLSIRRVQTSRAMVLRQVDAERLELFALAFDEPLRNATELVQSQHSIHVLLQMNNLGNVAHRKKLHRMMLVQARRSASHLPTNADTLQSACGLCAKSLRTLLFSSPGRICQLCKQSVCARCVVVKKIVVDASVEPVESKTVGVCLVCIMSVKNQDVRELALQDQRERGQVQHLRQRPQSRNEYSLLKPAHAQDEFGID